MTIKKRKKYICKSTGKIFVVVNKKTAEFWQGYTMDSKKKEGSLTE